MIEPNRTVTVEPENPSNLSLGPDPLYFAYSVRPCSSAIRVRVRFRLWQGSLLVVPRRFAETASERSTAELLWALPHLKRAITAFDRQCGLVSAEIARRRKVSTISRGTTTPIVR